MNDFKARAIGQTIANVIMLLFMTAVAIIVSSTGLYAGFIIFQDIKRAIYGY